MQAYLTNLLHLTLEAAPWLLIGLLAAGLIKAWVPEALMSRWLGGRGPWPVAKAALVGAPLPLCSCGVVPAALGLRRAGASKGATAAFLVATPETGVDSVALSYALLGPFLALVRPGAAVLSAVFTGLLVGLGERLAPTAPTAAPAGGCCSGGGCGAAQAPGPWARAGAGLRYALTDVLDDIAPWLGLGLGLAAAVQTLVSPEALAQYGSGLPAMLLMLAVGVPMYICATASTPLAAALLLAGVSPGTVLVFLLAGPATNLGTVAILRRELGTRATLAYLAGIALSAVALGLATDALTASLGIDVNAQLGAAEALLPPALQWLCAALLLAFALRPLRRRLLARLDAADATVSRAH